MNLIDRHQRDDNRARFKEAVYNNQPNRALTEVQAVLADLQTQIDALASIVEGTSVKEVEPAEAASASTPKKTTSRRATERVADDSSDLA